ncbi:MAG: hypothetical protein AAFQ98_06840 [Bacteroidota bacterium]
MSFAQQRECATIYVHQAQIDANPIFGERMRQIEEHIHRSIKEGAMARSEVTRVVLFLPS